MQSSMLIALKSKEMCRFPTALAAVFLWPKGPSALSGLPEADAAFSTMPVDRGWEALHAALSLLDCIVDSGGKERGPSTGWLLLADPGAANVRHLLYFLKEKYL